MKIFFVGMYNKKGLLPLDSSTKTGKIIDAIIKELPHKCEYVKTNLCDISFLPKNIKAFAENWHDRYRVYKKDIVILLGKWVQKNFIPLKIDIINFRHPASIYGTENIQKYINGAVKIIIKKL